MDEVSLLDDGLGHPKPERPTISAFAEKEVREASDAGGGTFLRISEEDADKLNYKVLLAANESPARFVIAAEKPLSLLFFRRMFARLKEQQTVPPERDRASPGSSSEMEELDDRIPTAAFQRAMGRLFYALRDSDEFDATVYDTNDNGYVGWGEFTQVWKDRQITVRLSLSERIFFTLDDPQSSRLAKFISIFTLLTILISSLGFIISTIPQLQEPSKGSKPPKPGPIFDIIENTCLVIFVLEYSLRLCTCPSVRNEISDIELLMETAVGYGSITLSTPFDRMYRFLMNPANIIDLAAILPGCLTFIVWLIDAKSASSVSGGGFVVLRLVRLTRIFRAFRIGKYMEPVIVLWRTVKQSTKALYVLAFNLFLGVVVFGSLIYLVEQGTWNNELQAYERKVGEHWDAEQNRFVFDWSRSPWKSIPHSFWWATVTAAGVGYGDMEHYPTSPNGKIVAAICMIWSIVILALPVGLMGGTFIHIWHDFDKQKRRDAEKLRREMMYVASALERIEPAKVSRVVLLEVWAYGAGDLLSMPTNPEGFMGEAKIELEITQKESVSRDLKLPLRANGQICDRKVSGNIYIRYDWIPSPKERPDESGNGQDLDGELRFYVLGGSDLIDTDWSNHSMTSNPCVLMVCYPHAPSASTDLEPVVWLSSVARNSKNPSWDCSVSFQYRWFRDARASAKRCLSHRFTRQFSPNVPDGDASAGAKTARLANSLSRLVADLPKVTSGIEKLQEEVLSLTTRVDHMESSAARLAESEFREKSSSLLATSATGSCGTD